jgi:hypothetical protein
MAGSSSLIKFFLWKALLSSQRDEPAQLVASLVRRLSTCRGREAVNMRRRYGTYRDVRVDQRMGESPECVMFESDSTNPGFFHHHRDYLPRSFFSLLSLPSLVRCHSTDFPTVVGSVPKPLSLHFQPTDNFETAHSRFCLQFYNTGLKDLSFPILPSRVT